jgi:DNA-binding GntR family transcriptional regulator
MEIYHIREALEGMAARLAAGNMEPEEIAELRKIVETQRNEISGGNYAYFLKEVDLDFHFRIIQGSRNKRLIRLLCKDLYDLVRFYRASFSASSPRPEEAYEEHSAIVAAMERGDGEMAELLMRHHIRASRENARQSFEAMQGQPAREQTEQARKSAS